MSLPTRGESPTPQARLAGSHQGLAGFIDVETTGLDPRNDEIVEFALILFTFDRQSGAILQIVDEYVGLRQPSKPIPQDAARIHGITDEEVRGRRLDELRILHMLGMCEFVVAHNARFDQGFVTRLFPMAAHKPWMCSMRDIDWYGKGHTSRGLQALLKDHGLRVEKAHRGDADARAALRLLSQQGPSAAPYFAELLQNYITRHQLSNARSLG